MLIDTPQYKLLMILAAAINHSSLFVPIQLKIVSSTVISDL